MGFHEVLYPLGIDYGSSAGPGFNVGVIQLDSGAPMRVARWPNPVRRYNAKNTVQSYEDLVTLTEFIVARGGPENGFRWSDPLDFTTASDHRSAPSNTDSVIGVADGSTTQFQLLTYYRSSTGDKQREIRKPVFGTTLVAIDGVNQPSGWDVDTTTGIVTFTTAPSGSPGVITAGCEFDVPVFLEGANDQLFSISMDTFSTASMPDVILVEDVSVVVHQEDYYFGSSASYSITESTQVSVQAAALIGVDALASGLSVYLPSPSTVPTGIMHAILHNTGANNWALKTGSTTIVATVAPGDKLILCVQLVSGVRSWVAV